eukprot:6544419-Pyramimonas_sp.AAC.1
MTWSSRPCWCTWVLASAWARPDMRVREPVLAELVCVQGDRGPRPRGSLGTPCGWGHCEGIGARWEIWDAWEIPT